MWMSGLLTCTLMVSWWRLQSLEMLNQRLENSGCHSLRQTGGKSRKLWQFTSIWKALALWNIPLSVTKVQTCFLVGPQLSELYWLLEQASSRWLNPEQLVVIVVFHNLDPFSWCPTAPEICFLCWLDWPPIFFPQNQKKDKHLDWLTVCCNRQTSSGFSLVTQVPVGVFSNL